MNESFPSIRNHYNNPCHPSFEKWYAIQVYGHVPLQRGLIYHDITYDIGITVAESESDIRVTTDTSYRALTGELWGVYWEEFGENRPRYNGTALYLMFPEINSVRQWFIHPIDI